ncbi:28S ribosomal protein S18b, mitochondrial [Silurus meridionalis]|uniref:Small ribosomal subunit protein mS40 n=1 Tax=Silurus meridionalis TaxID=175797 RepID=A0A8T0A5J8_SILME|nr:28S ribosomal protein S18b, mitochondrial [Silurus meridionalis]KAF7686177.1 hypothetical protein HF521_015539 [Silurus meridionalis]
MAASLQSIVRAVSRVSPTVLQRTHRAQTIRNGVRVLFVSPVLRHFSNSAHLACDGVGARASEALESQSRYKEIPWEYLESEEYIERYGSRLVWSDYRRNHKGGIPPQKTRKTCIRGEKICGNPCPICRDQNIIIHYQNVKLLQQFISPHTGMLYDSTRTGVCRKQQKQLAIAIETARDHGLIPTQLPFVDFSGEDFSNSHLAVGRTPVPPGYSHGETWYAWYGAVEPDERELARVKKLYKPYLK